MSVTQKVFGKTKQGEEVFLYSIKNTKGITAEVTNYGAILVNLFVPDKNGNVEDIVLGYDKVEDYFENGCFFGATIGPNANRIANAKFSIDGVTYQLAVNDNQNNLHSDAELGYHKCLFNAKVLENGVTFTKTDVDGNMGFPGNKTIEVTYTLSEENELQISYFVTSDKKTVINMTNHSYFNLAGHKAAPVYDHKLWIKASRYTPVVAGAIPTGELAPVAGTVFDFTTEKKVGQDINADCEQLKLVKGYDHNFVVDDYNGQLQLIAKVTEETSGRSMEVYTDLPGVQFYAGNCITPHTGKENTPYGVRSGLCLETQVFPNSANEASFPDTVFGPGNDYKTTTIYKFV